MIRQMFKLMWNRKKRNFLLMCEILLSFLVLFAVACVAISGAVKYFSPRGFEYHNRWILHVGWRGVSDKIPEPAIRNILRQIQNELASCEEVDGITWSTGNYPYSGSTWRTYIEWEGAKIGVDYFGVDDDFADVLGLTITSGRWFSSEDDAASAIPVVINQKLKKDVAGDRPVIGQTYTSEEKTYEVIGVVEDYRYMGEFESHIGGLFRRQVLDDMTSELSDVGIIAVREGTGVRFEEELIKRLQAVAGDISVRIETLEDTRQDYIKGNMMSLLGLSLVGGFLVFNVALGLFGILWYSISRRRGEIGLRRAVGARAWNISQQILGEALALASLAVVVGIFIAAQAPVLGLAGSVPIPTYAISMAAAALLIYIIVAVCALYPSWLAAMVQPAEALHDE